MAALGPPASKLPTAIISVLTHNTDGKTQCAFSYQKVQSRFNQRDKWEKQELAGESQPKTTSTAGRKI